jgi:N-carbamoyl-L-amino-acid hydrolase
MMFVQCLGGISHNKLEDTREDHLELSVAALDRLASKTVDWVLGGQHNTLSGTDRNSRL